MACPEWWSCLKGQVVMRSVLLNGFLCLFKNCWCPLNGGWYNVIDLSFLYPLMVGGQTWLL